MDNAEKEVLDSTNDLIGIFKNEDDFIRHFIESSYFFQVDDVIKRGNEIENIIKNNGKLPVRFSQIGSKYFTYDHSKKKMKTRKTRKLLEEMVAEDNLVCNKNKIQITLDSTGNKTIVDLIYANTNRIVSYGSSSNMFNYTISHVWKGKTFDPMYFSSLWNVVLIPNYLNYIMDKPAEQHTVNNKIQGILRAICFQLYQPDKLHLNLVEIEQSAEYYDFAKKAIKNKWVKFIKPIKSSCKSTNTGEEKVMEKQEYINNKNFIVDALNLINEFEIPMFLLNVLTDKDKCKELFNMNYPVLCEEQNLVEKRYYKNNLFQYWDGKDKKYFITNDWYPEKREFFTNWLEKVLKSLEEYEELISVHKPMI